MDIFFDSLNVLNSTFCLCKDGFQGLLKANHCHTQLLTFYLLLWNYFWNDFTVSILNEQTKTFSLDFSSTKKQKLVKTISAWTESSYLLLYAFKKYSSCDTIPLKWYYSVDFGTPLSVGTFVPSLVLIDTTHRSRDSPFINRQCSFPQYIVLQICLQFVLSVVTWMLWHTFIYKNVARCLFSKRSGYKNNLLMYST